MYKASSILTTDRGLNAEEAHGFSNTNRDKAPNLVRSLTAIRLKSQRVDQCFQRCRLLPPTRAVQEVPGKRRTPVVQHADKCGFREVWTAAILFFRFATRPVVDRVILR